MKVRRTYTEAHERSIEELRTIAQSLDMRDLAELSLPEVEAVLRLMDEFAPAGDVSGVISTGRARLPHYMRVNPKPNPNLLSRQWGKVRDKAVYTTFFAGPARVIWLYQNLLKAAGYDLEQSFPDGYWQFYVDYALREDTARHANETHGFDSSLRRHNLELSRLDRMTAWVMAAIYCLHQYDDLLQNEWRERVYTAVLRTIILAKGSEALKENFPRNKLYRQWERQRPYRRGNDVRPGQSYVHYRREKFDNFMEAALRDLPNAIRQEWAQTVRLAKQEELPAYQRQMSILATLRSGVYGEERRPSRWRKHKLGLFMMAATSSSPFANRAPRSQPMSRPCVPKLPPFCNKIGPTSPASNSKNLPAPYGAKSPPCGKNSPPPPLPNSTNSAKPPSC
jgi:hypothetical protein